MTAFLEVNNISKTFGGVNALSGINITLAVGEVHCLVGENGSGKSTLIKIIAGLHAPSPGGDITVLGRKHDRLTPAESTASGIQIIYQDLSLFPNLTVAENIAIARHGGRLHLVSWQEIAATAQAAMDLIGFKIAPDILVRNLPMSSRQLVAICRALAAEARLVIMDEPTASLTRQEVSALLNIVRGLKERGIGTIFVSHRLDEVLEVAERVTVLCDGRSRGTFLASEIDDKKLALLMTGKEFSYALHKKSTSGLKPRLSTHKLTRHGEYNDISIDVFPGEIVGLTGLLGSGRTELALSLFGMTRPDSGEIRIDNKPVQFRSNREAIANGIAYVPEDRLALGLVLDQSISRNLLLTVLRLTRGRLGLLSEEKQQNLVGEWVRRLTIKVSDPENAVSTLSGGNQQRVVIAKWLASSPRLLILDNPTVGVDIGNKDGIYEIMKSLAAQGLSILMISDEIPEVFYHAHRVLVMRNGSITTEVLPSQSSEQELMDVING